LSLYVDGLFFIDGTVQSVVVT